MLQLRKCNKKNNLSGHVKLIRPEITVLTEKVEEKLDLIRSKFSEKTIEECCVAGDNGGGKCCRGGLPRCPKS